MKKCLKTTAACLLTGLFFLGAAGNIQASAVPDKAEKKSSESQAAQTKADKASADKAAEQRKKITEEAIAAVGETKKALKALEEGKTDDAIKALEVATGKLELILARDPKLALVPVDVNVVTYDLYADVDTVKEVIKEARKALEDGKVQDARHMLSSLASEVVINTTSIPLATYPEAIKAISPLLDKGETEKAKAALQAALDTLVVTSEAVPLPLLRTQYMLARAEALVQKKERSDDENKELEGLLKAADQELELAAVLGYGHGKDFKPLHDQIESIRKKSSGGKSGEGWFDELKKKLSDLF